MPSFRHAMQAAERPFNCETGNFLVISGTNDKYIYLFYLLQFMAYKNRRQMMKCKRVKDPILKQITSGTKMKIMIQIKLR